MKQQKKEVREEVKRRISALTSEYKAVAAQKIATLLEQNEQLATAGCVALFVSMEDEISTANLLEKLSQRTTVALPRITGDDMQFFAYRGELKSGKFGIGEPATEELISPAEIDVMIIPARALTPQGERLGRGKGFYDKYLSHNDFRAYTIGIGYTCQLFDSLPTEEHDHRVDLVVTA